MLICNKIIYLIARYMNYNTYLCGVLSNGHFLIMYYIQFLDESFNEMRRLMNRNFRVKLDGVLCGFSRLCVILGNSRAFELVRRALLCTDYKFSPRALCGGHKLVFYSK